MLQSKEVNIIVYLIICNHIFHSFDFEKKNIHINIESRIESLEDLSIHRLDILTRSSFFKQELLLVLKLVTCI